MQSFIHLYIYLCVFVCKTYEKKEKKRCAIDRSVVDLSRTGPYIILSLLILTCYGSRRNCSRWRHRGKFEKKNRRF